MRKDFFYRLGSGLIVVPPLAQGIQENANELEALLQIVVERIVGAPSAELVALVKAQICRAPGIAYAWPGNVRELEQRVRRMMLKREYTPLAPRSPSGLISELHKGIEAQSLNAKALVGGYCLLLHRQHQTIEAVAKITGLDRRTAKKHIEEGRRRFASGN